MAAGHRGKAQPYSAGNFAITIDGCPDIGLCQSVAGGNVVAELATHQQGPQLKQMKQITDVKVEPITMEIGMGMGKGLFEWMESSFKENHITKGGSISTLNQNTEEVEVRQFADAHITEVTFPALSSDAKEAAYLSIKLDPRDIVWSEGSGKKSQAVTSEKQKKWTPKMFKVNIDKMPCASISKVDSFTWKQLVTRNAVCGEEGQHENMHDKVPCKIEVPNIKLTMNSTDRRDWDIWFKHFVIDGNREYKDHKSGSIIFTDGASTEIARLDLIHCGIIKCEEPKLQGNQESLNNFVVELYVEDMEFVYGNSD